MKYTETIRAPTDHLVADIFRIEKSNLYVIRFYEITDHSKRFIGRKLRATLNDYGFQSIKDEIKERLFQKVWQTKKNIKKRNFRYKITGLETQAMDIL